MKKEDLIIFITALVAAIPAFVYVLKKRSFFKKHFPDGITQANLERYRMSVSSEEYRKFLNRTISAREATQVADAERGVKTDASLLLELELLKASKEQYG